ncbi:MAG: hypothetical protein MI923_00105 [Phycisphaerales bacterium]|nr:hypothetical protein [Phycisphaerales bacterium]
MHTFLWVSISRSVVCTAYPTGLRCGYSLIGNLSGTCPECGTPVPDEKKKEPATAS